MRWSPIYSDWLSSADKVEIGPVEDRAMLELAEQEVKGMDPLSDNALGFANWESAMRPARVGGYLINPGANAFLITSCLESANIPYAWDPYPPQLMPMYRPGSGAIDRPFALYVQPSDLEDASALLADLGFKTSDWSSFSAPITPDRTPEAEQFRLVRFFWIMVAYSPQILVWFVALTGIVALRWAVLLSAAARFARSLLPGSR